MSAAATQYLYQLLSGAQVVQPVAAAAKLGLADLLAEGARGVDELAGAAGCDAGALERLLRALAALGIVVERGTRRYALGAPGQLLREGVPGSLRAVAMLAGEPWRAAAFDLADCVRSGQPAFERRFGAPLYRYLEEHPDEGARFDAVQAAHADAVDLAALGDLDEARLIVDVGGGSGSLLARVLEARTHLGGVLVERPATAERARALLLARGLGERVGVVAGDFFESVPEGGEVYLLAFVLHNWDDARAGRILDRCAAAMRPGARLLLVENLLAGAPATALLDLEMLVFHDGGRERTEAEYRALLQAAGFIIRRVTSTASTAQVIDAVRGTG